jgi:hypothetical protein
MIWRRGLLQNIRSSLEHGESYATVAKRLGVSRYTLRAALKYYDMLPVKMGTWRPIDTAPRDWPILTYDGTSIDVAKYSTREKRWLITADHTGITGAKWVPTHWMLLPMRPEEKGDE